MKLVTSSSWKILLLIFINMSFLSGKDLIIQTPENSNYKIQLSPCSPGSRTNSGRFIDLYFKYDREPGAVLYRSGMSNGKGWILVPDQKTSKAIITIEATKKEREALLSRLESATYQLKSEKVEVAKVLSELTDQRISIESRRADIINHNSIYYKLTASTNPQNVQHTEPIIFTDDSFHDIILSYLPAAIRPDKNNYTIDFEKGLITLKNIQIAKSNNYFDAATIDQLTLPLKHCEFSKIIDCQPKTGQKDPEFDAIMKKELSNSIFQIKSNQAQNVKKSQKFGYNTIIPAILPKHQDVSVYVFNDNIEIDEGKMVDGKIQFLATLDPYKKQPNLSFFTEKLDDGNFSDKEILDQIEVYFNGKLLSRWQYGDPLYDYEGINYTFKLKPNKKYAERIEGRLHSGNFDNCNLYFRQNITRIYPDFVLNGNYITSKTDIFPVSIGIDIPADELPITFQELITQHGEQNNLSRYIHRYITGNERYTIDPNQTIDETNQYFQVSRPVAQKEFEIEFSAPGELVLLDNTINYSVIPFLDPQRIKNREQTLVDNRLKIKGINWPEKPDKNDFIIVNLEAPFGYEFKDGSASKTLTINSTNYNPVIKLKRSREFGLFYSSLKELTRKHEIDSTQFFNLLKDTYHQNSEIFLIETEQDTTLKKESTVF